MNRAGGLLGLLLAAPLASAQVDLGGGSELFSLLQRPAGARALGLGSAFEALADDPSAALWNPAAPAVAPGLGLSMHHELWLAGTEREVLSAQLPLGSRFGLGLHGALVDYEGSEQRDEDGQLLGLLRPQEQSVGGNLSVRLGDFALGLGARGLRLQLDQDGLSSVAGDAGLLWQAAPALRLAVVAKALPREDGVFKASGVGAVAYQLGWGDWRLDLAGAVRLDPEAASELDLGVELGFGRALPVAMRAGYSQDLPAFSENVSQRFSAGVGAGVGQYRLDYAFLPWGSFGATHRVSLSYAQPYPRPEQPRPMPSAEPTPAPTPSPSPMAQPQPAPLATPTPQPAPAPQLQTRFRVLSDAVVQARGLEAAGDIGGAMKLYHQAASADPADLAAWKGLAWIYQRAGQGAYARQCWQQVRRLDPSDPEAAAYGGP